jgi:hypothetical protein
LVFSEEKRVTSAVPKANPSGNEPAGKPKTDAMVAATPGARTKAVPVYAVVRSFALVSFVIFGFTDVALVTVKISTFASPA